MTDTRINPPQGKEPLPIQTCQKKHQAWTTAIEQNEQIINHLLKLLLNVLEQHTYQNLHYQAVYFYGDLKRLKDCFQRFRLDIVCERTCFTGEHQPSCKPRLDLFSTMAIDSYLDTLTEELDRIKAECNQLLSVIAS